MNGQEQVPSYGVIDHYLGEKGRRYFESRGALKTQGQFNLHFWRPHIAATDEVLDFGCGGGFLLRNLQAERKVGVEINPHARAFGQSQGTEIVPRWKMRAASSIRSSPVTPSSTFLTHGRQSWRSRASCATRTAGCCSCAARRLAVALATDGRLGNKAYASAYLDTAAAR